MERKEEMETDRSAEYIGQQFGHEAVEHVLQRAEDYCECEKQRIEVANQPKILALRAEMSLLVERERDLKERVRQAPPPGDLCSRRRRSRYYWAVTLFLGIAGFFFSLLAFDPYQLGWKSYLYCVGIAVVSPFCVDKFLESWGNPRLIKALAAVACTAALTSLVLLALIRGDVLIQYVQTANPVVIFGGESPVSSEPQNNFFGTTLPRLRLLMALLALAMELGAGLALYDARRLGLDSGEDSVKINSELLAIQQEMVTRVHEISILQNAPAAFVTQFWRDFYRAMLNGTVRSALTKFSLLLLCVLLLGPGAASAAERVHLVVALDLSKSVAVTDRNQMAEFEKNLAGVTHLLASLPAGSRATVVEITDNSFAQPYVLLAAEVGEDEGYFRERLTAARRQVVSAWKQRCIRLQPEFSHTDIFGALIVAAELFSQTPRARKMFVIFSDMRHETATLDLETPSVLSGDRLLAKVEKHKLLADLQGVEVYALGVDGAGKSVAYWNSLRGFWEAYFCKAGAALKTYSVLRDSPSAVQPN